MSGSVSKVLVIGSGPITIGQAAEFDYSGSQACRSLSEEGVEVILVNSNPATIMTDVETADRVYIEPLTVEFLTRVIARERPQGLLATLGGQTGLNLAVALAEAGVLEEYGVRLLGTPLEAIRHAEDRELFKDAMRAFGEPVPESVVATTVEEARAFAARVGFPVVIRPAYTLGGTGGGIAPDARALDEIAARGLAVSRIHQVLVERSVAGWKEIEYEVMRDRLDTCITVCNMENLDPMGVHTGDSIVIAPSQTLSDREYQMLRSASLRIIRGLGIEGGCNIQFALDPESTRYYVIEVNPRVSRSSALASKATGYPIARVAAKIALGRTLDEIRNAITGETFACFEPALDYAVVKIPRWPFDKFPYVDRRLGTQMQATGEVMAIGRSVEEALLKALRSLDQRVDGLDYPPAADWSREALRQRIADPCDERLFAIAEGLRRGMLPQEIADLSRMDLFFVNKIANIVGMLQGLRSRRDPETLRAAKRLGLPDTAIARAWETTEDAVRAMRTGESIRPVYKIVDTCAGEFPAKTPYFYSTYAREDEVPESPRRRIVVLGSGPIRIGQGIEFDYASVHAVKALRDDGLDAVLINNNPETVSTDFDVASRLYVEPLTVEDVLNVIERERADGVIVQVGGQTGLNLAGPLAERGVRVLGTTVEGLDASEDRGKFDALLRRLDIAHPAGGAVRSVAEGRALADRLGFPLLVRPSYVLGGRGMEIVAAADELVRYLEAAFAADREHPVLIDTYVEGTEVEVDAISDGDAVFLPGIMEHIERAGVHSGDSIAVFPAQHLGPDETDQVIDATVAIARALGVRGFLNIQFVVKDGRVYVLEANLRSSRTIPFVSKAAGAPLVRLAVHVMLGRSLADLGYPGVTRLPAPARVSVKAPVFSSEKMAQLDVLLGPEMTSTGEVMGQNSSLPGALYRALVAAGIEMPDPAAGRALLASIADRDKAGAVELVRRFVDLGFTVYATDDTAKYLADHGVHAIHVSKNGDPETALRLVHERAVSLVLNTPTRGRTPGRAGFALRRAAFERHLPCFTSLDTAEAFLDVLTAIKAGEIPAPHAAMEVSPL
ncbi:MAG TPA: carbamoyl-phosphate synthase (glutamine-hydrolyzing) large subunit [bacterium]|nr:carbamoyl-phosphate synthase (glutamine-hydrolyzing) large subunit [bacterium]